MHYLTIHEFGSLRGVSVGSLRYYEKLGLLKPAKIDPKTGYRYYLPEQLETLDAIHMCVALDIPLKELTGYISDKGDLDLKGILTRGRQVLMDKLDQLNTTLQVTEYGLNMLKGNEAYHGRKGVYQRQIGDRWFYLSPLSGDKKKLQSEQKELLAHFHELQSSNKVPFFPAGLLLDPSGDKVQYYFYIQILHPDAPDSHYIHIPAGSFSCLQWKITYRPEPDEVLNILDTNFPDRGKKPVIITNMMAEKMRYQSRMSEIQIPDTGAI
jgi:DNA-binding transcriptional MerR regulator